MAEDIVTRLRKFAGTDRDAQVCRDAAAEIEQLRDALVFGAMLISEGDHRYLGVHFQAVVMALIMAADSFKASRPVPNG